MGSVSSKEDPTCVGNWAHVPQLLLRPKAYNRKSHCNKEATAVRSSHLNCRKPLHNNKHQGSWKQIDEQKLKLMNPKNSSSHSPHCLPESSGPERLSDILSVPQMASNKSRRRTQSLGSRPASSSIPLQHPSWFLSPAVSFMYKHAPCTTLQNTCVHSHNSSLARCRRNKNKIMVKELLKAAALVSEPRAISYVSEVQDSF